MNKLSGVTLIDKEEYDLQESLVDLDIKVLSKPTIQQQQKFLEAAKNYVKKESKMNIRIDPFELEAIKKCAESKGLKYQTFIKNVLHKYISGELVDSRKINSEIS
jgi:predicted DNA binding CopG/RHH family protein